MERNAYAIIRRAAPDTHVLFFSYATPTNAAAFSGHPGPGRSVDWSNCSVALHGYGVTDEALEAVVREVRGAGYCLVNTEPRNLSGEIVNFRQARVHERNGVSYLHFLTAEEAAEPARFALPIARARVSWKPDFGDWPPALFPPPRTTRSRPWRPSSSTRRAARAAVVDYGNRVGSISRGDFTLYDDFDFKSGTQAFEARVSSGGAAVRSRSGWTRPTASSSACFLSSRPAVGTTGNAVRPCSENEGRSETLPALHGGPGDLFDVDWFVFK